MWTFKTDPIWTAGALAGSIGSATLHATRLAAPVMPAGRRRSILMGKKGEKRFAYIQANAKFVEDVDVSISRVSGPACAPTTKGPTTTESKVIA